MPVDYSILQPVNINPLGAAMQASQFRAQEESTRALAEQRRLAAQQREQAISDQASLDKAVTPGATLDGILSQLPGHMHAAVRKQWADADKASQDARDAKTKAASAEADYFGTLAATVKSYGYDPSAAQIVLSHAKAEGHDTSQVEQLLGQDPSKLQQVVDGLIAASPKQRELANSEKGTAETGRHNLVAESSTAAGQAETGRHNLIAEAAQAAGQKETARHDRALEAQATAGDAAVPLLTPEGRDLAAKQFAMTGQLIPMGMGKEASKARAGIINRAAEMYSGLDLASQQAAYAANKSALVKLRGQREALGAFEGTALKNLDLFLSLATKVPDSGSPALNQPLRYANEKMFGGDALTAFNTARRTVVPEFAKILANPGLSGQLSDTARKEIEDVVSGNATLKQTIAAAKVLKTDAANRRTAYDDQITGLEKMIATPPGQKPAAATVDPLGIRK